MTTPTPRYIIIGGVAGGATAAARIRRLTEKAEIILIEKGAYISYANCGLPYYIGGVIADRDRLFVQTPESFGRRFNIDVRTLSEVIAIDPSSRQVTVRTADGSRYVEPYDKLLLSPGASPVVPPLPGIDSEGIFTLRNVADTDRIKSYMTDHDVKRAVIVGGGFIGLEMAENLMHAGAQVAVVEMANQVMAPIDYSMASLVHEHLQQHGVQLYLEQAVDAFSRHDGSLTVHFKSGVGLQADMVLLSIGVRAETRLAQAAGIRLGEMRGIWVDDYLQTSAPDVYAVGDAIEFPHPVTGKPWLNFLAGPANRQARIVADNMVMGNKVKYEGSIGTSIAKVFDLTVASTGLPAKRLKMMDIPYLSATIHSGAHTGYYPGSLQMDIKITFSPTDGKLYGAQIVGYDGVDKRIDQYALAIKQGATVADLTRLEHAYAPPFSSAKDPVAITGYVAGNILSGKMSPLYWRELRDADLTGVTLVDVRTPDEYALGTIDGAVNIPLDDLRERMDEIPTGRPVWLFCGIGLRGYLASNILKDNGYAEVRNLIGGLKTYRAATARIAPPEGFAAAGDSASSTETASAEKAVVRIDACGIQCPGPILRLKQAIDTLASGDRLEVTATDAAFPPRCRGMVPHHGPPLPGPTCRGRSLYRADREVYRLRRRVCPLSAHRSGQDPHPLQRRPRQGAGHLCPRQRSRSHGPEGEHLLHLLGAQRHQEGSQTQGQQRPFRAYVQLDAAFRLHPSRPLQDEHDGHRRQNDAPHHDPQGRRLARVAAAAGHRQRCGVHSLPDVDGCDGREARRAARPCHHGRSGHLYGARRPRQCQSVYLSL